MTFEEWWEKHGLEVMRENYYDHKYVALNTWQAATERAAGKCEDDCLWDAKQLMEDGKPCNCSVCTIAQKIREQTPEGRGDNVRD